MTKPFDISKRRLGIGWGEEIGGTTRKRRSRRRVYPRFNGGKRLVDWRIGIAGPVFKPGEFGFKLHVNIVDTATAMFRHNKFGKAADVVVFAVA